MLDKLLRPLGLESWEDATYSRPITPVGLARVANRLLGDGYRVVVGITYAGSGDYNEHAVGLLPTGEKNYVTLVSNHVPKCLQGVVSLHKVGEHLAVNKLPSNDEYPFMNSTLTALPPAA